jgi:hypothetical protein
MSFENRTKFVLNYLSIKVYLKIRTYSYLEDKQHLLLLSLHRMNFLPPSYFKKKIKKNEQKKIETGYNILFKLMKIS